MLLSEIDRNKGIKLILRIIDNIVNNPSQTQKYGNLNLQKIKSKLKTCQPALELLFLSGFTKTPNNERLIWRNTNDNIMRLRHINLKLSSMTNNPSSISNTTSNNVNGNYEVNKMKSLLFQQIADIKNRMTSVKRNVLYVFISNIV